MLEQLVHSIFIAHGCYSIVFVLFNTFSKSPFTLFSQRFDRGVAVILSISGLFYLLRIIVICTGQFLESAEHADRLTERMTGPYAAYFWIPLFITLIYTQGFLFKVIRDMKWKRVLASSIFLIMTCMEAIIILMTSFHRDYMS